jgi:putative addiction module component (TIGR02574 family)
MFQIMTAAEHIHELPLSDKLAVMEAIWEDLRRGKPEVEMPDWHQSLLDEREELLREGKAKFIPWEQARQEIAAALA